MEHVITILMIVFGFSFSGYFMYSYGFFKGVDSTKSDKPILTRKERLLCELIETGYIARDEDGELWYFIAKPIKDTERGRKAWDYPIDYEYYHSCRLVFDDIFETCCNDSINFSFITWNDEEPWAVKDLLKLKVED